MTCDAPVSHSSYTLQLYWSCSIPEAQQVSVLDDEQMASSGSHHNTSAHAKNSRH